MASCPDCFHVILPLQNKKDCLGRAIDHTHKSRQEARDLQELPQKPNIMDRLGRKQNLLDLEKTWGYIKCNQKQEISKRVATEAKYDGPSRQEAESVGL